MALFVSLVLLLMLTIIGVSAVRTSTLEMRMVRNSHDAMLAFQAAEAALREAESSLVGLAAATGFSDGGVGGRWTAAPLGEADRWTISGVWADGSDQSIAATATGPASSRYLIEHLATLDATSLTDSDQSIGSDPNPAPSSTMVFRVTARASGAGEFAVAMLQSTYAVPLQTKTSSTQETANAERWSWQELVASY